MLILIINACGQIKKTVYSFFRKSLLDDRMIDRVIEKLVKIM